MAQYYLSKPLAKLRLAAGCDGDAKRARSPRMEVLWLKAEDLRRGCVGSLIDSGVSNRPAALFNGVYDSISLQALLGRRLSQGVEVIVTVSALETWAAIDRPRAPDLVTPHPSAIRAHRHCFKWGRPVVTGRLLRCCRLDGFLRRLALLYLITALLGFSLSTGLGLTGSLGLTSCLGARGFRCSCLSPLSFGYLHGIFAINGAFLKELFLICVTQGVVECILLAGERRQRIGIVGHEGGALFRL